MSVLKAKKKAGRAGKPKGVAREAVPRAKVPRPMKGPGLGEVEAAPGAPNRNGSAAPAPVPRAPEAADDGEPVPGGPRTLEPRAPWVVAIGASAGGLDAFTRLFRRLPPDTGLAFVLAQHLDPSHESILSQLLGEATRMPVEEARADERLEPDRVYVIPPDTLMSVEQGRIRLEPRLPRGPNLPVDFLLRSLAQDLGHQVVGVILSGMGNDGALGLAAVKAGGGLTFVEDEKTARFDGMPRAAIATGCADFVLGVDAIADELAALGRRLAGADPRATLADFPVDRDGELRKIFGLLRAAHAVDFTHYRQTTIKRRILRRMVLHKLHGLDDYLRYLHDRPAEVEALYQDILIKVTQFFRDPDMFEALKTRVFPALLEGRAPERPIRIWIPGCSTGEEAYSLAIALLEAIDERRANVPIQVFATDISETAIEVARGGAYVENIRLDVSPERLRRYFTKINDRYQVSKAVRDLCVFAKHNVTRDPPFSRIDLISCRNVLIYLEPILQAKVLPMFHYALNPGGFLVLGGSETAGPLADLFVLEDKRSKLYVKKPGAPRIPLELRSAPYPLAVADEGRPAPRLPESTSGLVDAQKEADRVVMSRFAPAGVIIDAELQILQFRGQTGRYLEPSPGEASLNLLKMAREGLMLELRAAVQRVKRGEGPVRTEGLHVRLGGAYREVAIEVVPLRGAATPGKESPADRRFLVLFEEPRAAGGGEEGTAKGRASKGKAGKPASPTQDARVVAKLQQELAATKDYLQAIIEEQEATNEELQSANEEILSSNEELQSINEELQTAKEELQSTNEELTTVNEELENRNLELSQVNSDPGNLLASVNIAIVMLGRDLRIRRFTPTAERVLNLIPSDLGRPVGDLKLKIDVPDLESAIAQVIDTVSIRERDVQDREGRWYSMRIRPYRTADDRVDGAVICLVDIDVAKRGLTAAPGPVAAEVQPSAPA